MATPKCALGRLIEDDPDYEELRRRAYREQGILVINMNKDAINDFDKEWLRQWAERRYPRKEQR